MGNGTKLRAVAFLVVVLAAGAAAGWVANDKTRPQRRLHRRNIETVMKRMTRDFSLTPAQQDSVRVIVARRRSDIDSLWVEMNPRFESIRSLANSQIEGLLNDQQRETFREDVRKRDERRRQRHPERSPR